MKRITIEVLDTDSSAVLTSIISYDLQSLSVETIGPDPRPEPVLAATPETPRKLHRLPDKTANDCVMEMFTEEHRTRDREAVADMLRRLGFAENTPNAAISKAVLNGQLERLQHGVLRATDFGLGLTSTPPEKRKSASVVTGG